MNFTKYDKLGAYHWREFDAPTKYREHALYVADWVRSGLTLDVGAGDGLITWILNGNDNISCVGIDDNPTAVRLATEHGVKVELLSVYDLNVKAQFDNIYCGDVIEHLEFPQKALARMKQALKPDGVLYLVTPPALPSGKIEDLHHYFEWTPEQLEAELHKAGFKLQSISVFNDRRRMYAKATKK